MKTKIYYRSMHSPFYVMLIAISIFILVGCNKKDVQTAKSVQAVPESDALTSSLSTQAMVLTWNEAGTIAIARMGSGADAIPPQPESRIYAILNIAIHDALNTVKPKFHRYILTDAVNSNASADAAVAQAAHDVIIAELPPQQAYADSLLQVSLAGISDGTAKTDGINIGVSSAAAILANRANDGAANAQFDIAQGTLPGQYRCTPPFDQTGFIAVPGWGNIIPFALHKGSQFRPSPPYDVTSAQYAKDVNEVKRLGGLNSTKRTAEQTEIALFWLENSPAGWNRIARTILAQHNSDAWQIARLLALVQIAEADANIASHDAKYHYFYWRPYTAIHLADTDDNPDTKADTTWEVLAFPTPPVPDYPSNHACNGAAAAAVIADFFHNNNISFSQTSTSLPGVTRSFTSLSQAANENAASRVYVGYHFRHAVDEGEKQGQKVGDYAYNHVLLPL